MPEKSEAARREEAILAFWERERIFEKSLAKKSPKGEYVFYDGPPFATGLPHYGHIVASVIKGCRAALFHDARLPCAARLGLGLPRLADRKYR